MRQHLFKEKENKFVLKKILDFLQHCSFNEIWPSDPADVDNRLFLIV